MNITKLRSSQILSIAVAGGVSLLLYRAFACPRVYLAPQIKARLPVAKKLPTVRDNDGNYDMDGVSFDSEGVIISSDNIKHVVSPLCYAL